VLDARAGPAADEAGIVVFVAPFAGQNLTPALAALRDELIIRLPRLLDDAGPLRAVWPTSYRLQWNEQLDRPAAVSVGRSLGAQLAVAGAVVRAGADSVRLRAEVVDVASGRIIADIPELRAHLERTDNVQDSLAMRILSALAPRYGTGRVRLPPTATQSPDALKAFWRGEWFYYHAAWDSAMAYYQRAIQVDSTFALALRRAGLVMSWQRNVMDSLTRSYFERAGRFNRGLPVRDSLLVAADSVRSLLADVESDTAYLPRTRRLFATLGEAVRLYPGDPETWYALGEAHYHFGLGPFVSVPSRQTLSAFERSIQLDSTFGPAYIHAVELAFTLDEPQLGLRYARSYLSLRPTDAEGIGIGLVERLVSSRASGSALRQLIDTASTAVLSSAWLTLRRWTDPGETAVAIARALASSRMGAAGPLDSVFARRRLAVQLAYRGRLREAYRTLGTPVSRLFAELALLGAVPRDTAVAVFGRWLEGGVRAASFALPWWSAVGDTAAIRAFARLAAPTAGPDRNPYTGSRGGYDAAAAAAYLALARRDTAEALRRFVALADSLCLACAADRLTRARLLMASEREREAAALLAEQLPVLLSPTELVYALERGRAALLLEDQETAAAAYGLVAAAWQNADPELQPVLAEASRALPRRGERRP
jgi:serine/threonine-protein kinase